MIQKFFQMLMNLIQTDGFNKVTQQQIRLLFLSMLDQEIALDLL